MINVLLLHRLHWLCEIQNALNNNNLGKSDKCLSHYMYVMLSDRTCSLFTSLLIRLGIIDALQDFNLYIHNSSNSIIEETMSSLVCYDIRCFSLFLFILCSLTVCSLLYIEPSQCIIVSLKSVVTDICNRSRVSEVSDKRTGMC